MKQFMQKIERNFNKILIAFYAFSFVFPSLRLAIIGKDRFKNIGEFLFSTSPDILTLLIAGIAIIYLV